MNPRHKPLAWTAAAIAVGVAAVLAVRGLGDEPVAPEPVAPAAIVEPAPAAAAAEAAPPLPTGPAPWEQAPSASAGGTAISALAAAQRPGATPAAMDTATQIATIRAQSQRNVAMVDDLLREIDELERSGKASPEMRLGALRGNLLIARRAQALALELAESTQQPDSPARRQRSSEIVAELQQLQGQLRYDLMPAGLPAAGQAQ